MSDCARRCAGASWWEWLEDSTLFFWRWPKSHVAWAMLGQPHFQTGRLPNFNTPQIPARTDSDKAKMKEKVMKVRQRGYIEAGFIASLTHMFHVPK